MCGPTGRGLARVERCPHITQTPPKVKVHNQTSIGTPNFGGWINRCLGRWRGTNDNCVKGRISVPYNQQPRILGRIMGARPAAGSLVDKVSRGLRKGFTLLVARVKALRRAVRVDDFRLAQRLRMGLVLYLRHLEEPLRNDVARLFEVSGLWVRNVGDRHYTKRQIQRMSRRIIQRLDVRSDSWKLKGGLSATAISTA